MIESRVSLKGVLVSIMFFTIAAIMHEAARADGAGQGATKPAMMDLMF